MSANGLATKGSAPKGFGTTKTGGGNVGGGGTGGILVGEATGLRTPEAAILVGRE